MPRHPDVATRFWSHVIRGPKAGDCWLWTAAIADDGYGRFWVTDGGRQRVVRPHRFALELATGRRLLEHEQVLHDCDVPLCVRGEADAASSHLRAGDNSANMRDRSRHGRYVPPGAQVFTRDATRRDRARRSRAIRAVLLKHGWDEQRLEAAISGATETMTPLF